MTTPDKAQLPPLAAVSRALDHAEFRLRYIDRLGSPEVPRNADVIETIKAAQVAIAALSTVPAAAPVMAWAHPDGRVVPAKTKADAEHDGGAFRSSLAGYTIPLVAAVPAAAPQGEPQCPGCGSSRVVTSVGMHCHECHGDFFGDIKQHNRPTPPAAAEGAPEPSVRELLEHIVSYSAGWDEHGSTGPRHPFTWETVGRVALDLARAALSTAPASEAVATDVLDYVKGIYDHLQSVAPAGAADEAFRLPPSPTRAQRALLDHVQGDASGERAAAARPDQGLGQADRSPVAPTPAVAPSEALTCRRNPVTGCADARKCILDCGLATPTEAPASALGAPASPSRSPLQPSVSAAIVGAEAMSRDVRMAVMLAYGHLWHVNSEPMAPIPMYSPEKAAYEARKQLRDLLSHQERGEAINQVGVLIGRYDIAAPNAGEQT